MTIESVVRILPPATWRSSNAQYSVLRAKGTASQLNCRPTAYIFDA